MLRPNWNGMKRLASGTLILLRYPFYVALELQQQSRSHRMFRIGRRTGAFFVAEDTVSKFPWWAPMGIPELESRVVHLAALVKCQLRLIRTLKEQGKDPNIGETRI